MTVATETGASETGTTETGATAAVATETAAEEMDLRLDTATVDDAAEIWHIVKESGVLDVNSSYAYLMFCRHFADTTVVARAKTGSEDTERVIGFVTALRPPNGAFHGAARGDDDVVFVWQVGVSEAARGRGVAGRLLQFLLRQPACAGVRYLETTVTPDNAPSRALFRGLARRLATRCEVADGFTPEQFPAGGHEPEELHRIGPFEVPTLQHM